MVLLVLSAAGCAERKAPAGLPAPQMIDAGGFRLETLVYGSGVPTVVFEAGNIGGMEVWRPLQEAVGQHTLTLSYERAGLGESEASPDPRTGEQISRDLRQLLTSAGASPPFVIVAHSAGGMYLRPFLARYAGEIAGIVLVDPSTPAIFEHMARSQPARWADYTREVRELYDPGPGWYRQWRVLDESMEQARAAWPLPEVPTVLFTALRPVEGEWPLDTPENMAVWLRSHEDLVGRIPNAEHVVLEQADHGSLLREDVLREKILAIVASAKD